MCSELKSALLLESINSIIYRERRNILFLYGREKSRRKYYDNRRTNSSKADVIEYKTILPHVVMSCNDTRIHYLPVISVSPFQRTISVYIWN